MKIQKERFNNSRRRLNVIANNVSEDIFYIQSATLNNETFNTPWIDYNTIMAGGILEFEMGPEPNVNWCVTD